MSRPAGWARRPAAASTTTAATTRFRRASSFHQDSHEVGRRRAFRPAWHAFGDVDSLQFPLGPDVRDNRQLGAGVERAGAHDRKAGPARVGVVDSRDAFRAAALLRGADVGALSRGAFVEMRLTGHLQRVLGDDELQAEGAAAPGLAVEAVAGIGVGTLVGLHLVAHRPAAAAAFECVGHVVFLAGARVLARDQAWHSARLPPWARRTSFT